MPVDKIPMYRNITYDYKTDDDTFVVRGLHLNQINDKLSLVIDEVNAGTGGLGAGSGLTENAGNIDLGGTLVGGTTFSYDETANLVIAPARSGVGSSRMELTYNTMFFGVSPVEPYDPGNTSEFVATSTGIYLRWYNPDYIESGMSFTASAIQILDSINSKGAIYTGNYDTNGILDDNWIPSYRAVKAYADSVVGSSYTFDSGLTEAAGSVNLGGALTQNATFSGSYDVTFGYISNIIGDFDVLATSVGLWTTGNSILGTTVGLNAKYFWASATALTIVDSASSKGVVYAANYDTNGIADDNWIPSYRAVKAYADSVGGGVTFGNDYQIPMSNVAGTDFIYDVDLNWNSDGLVIGSQYGSGPNVYISANGSSNLAIVNNGTTIISVQSHSNVASESNLFKTYRSGGTAPTATTPPTSAVVKEDEFYVHSGGSWVLGGKLSFEVDGVIGSNDFDTKYVWSLKEGAAANASMLTLGINGFEYTNDHSVDQVANDRWIPDWKAVKDYADGIGGSGTVTEVTSSTTNQLTVATGTTTPALTIVTGAVAPAGTALATGGQIVTYVTGLGYSTTVGTVTSVSGTGTIDGLTLSGTVTSTGNLTLSGNINVSSVTGTLPVANGGTGIATAGLNYMLTGNGIDALTAEPNLTFSGSTLAVTGAITATGEITAYSSDERLKQSIVRILNPIEKVKRLNGVTYEWNPIACKKAGFTPARTHETGMIAQNLGSVISDAISYAPFDRDYEGNSISGEDYLTVNLEKVVPLLVEAIKELTEELEKLKK